MINTARIVVAFTFMLLSSMSQAADIVKVSDAWVRASLPGQKVSAAYLTIESPADAKITRASSTASDFVEIHNMLMNDGVMQMRSLNELALNANKPLQLSPGGLHLMLIGLKSPLTEGTQVEISLTIESGGKNSTQTFLAPVRKP